MPCNQAPALEIVGFVSVSMDLLTRDPAKHIRGVTGDQYAWNSLIISTKIESIQAPSVAGHNIQKYLVTIS